MSAGMLGYVARQQPSPETFSRFSMGDAPDARKHASRGSLSRGPWNKCG